MATRKKQNYLNNKDILHEVHKSKMTFCYLADEKYFYYDLIVDSIDAIDDDAINEAKIRKCNKIQSVRYADAMSKHDLADYRNKPKQKDFSVDPSTIETDDVVFRVMTVEHIPDETSKKKAKKLRVNFPAFKHYAFVNGVLTEVARSHWNGDLQSGEFCITHGRITPKLGTMFMKLVERYSHRSNWRGYTYVDEMRGAALLQLSHAGLQFNEAKSDNPFAYFTATVNNCFRGVLNSEKKNQKIRDDILIEQGHLPSYSRQIEHENEMRQLRDSIESDVATIDSFGDV